MSSEKKHEDPLMDKKVNLTLRKGLWEGIPALAARAETDEEAFISAMVQLGCLTFIKNGLRLEDGGK